LVYFLPKNIQALKEQMEQLKKQSSTAIAPTVASGSMEELSAKLAAYQDFMATYIVKAQAEKRKAVEAAEAAISKKYEEKLNAFLLTPAPPSDTTLVLAPSVAAVTGSKLYMERNAKVAAAAEAGKSRWGDGEVQRVSSRQGADVVVPSSAATTLTTTTTSRIRHPCDSTRFSFGFFRIRLVLSSCKDVG